LSVFRNPAFVVVSLGLPSYSQGREASATKVESYADEQEKEIKFVCSRFIQNQQEVKMKRILYGILALTMLAVYGCTGDTNSLSNPTASNLVPYGTIQGKLVDVCTLQPIANALVDIGVAKATTNAAGQYVLANVPATQQGDGRYGCTYSATIDLRNAANAAGVAFAKGTYPEFAFNEMSVSFTTLEGSGNSSQDGYATANGNNPAVPVVGLAAAGQDLAVGALNGVIRGKVVDSALPAAGKIVALYATRYTAMKPVIRTPPLARVRTLLRLLLLLQTALTLLRAWKHSVFSKLK